MTTHFDVLGVARRFSHDRGTLEARYRELSKQLHPDRFAKASPKERLEALERTTRLNRAWEVLKDEVRRAEYLLLIAGIDLSDERAAQGKISQEVLLELLERNEALADARGAGDAARVRELGQAMAEERAATWREVVAAFERQDAGEPVDLDAVAEALLRLRYHARFLEQVEAFEAARDEAEPVL
jgi:molecular chaperone HscB